MKILIHGLSVVGTLIYVILPFIFIYALFQLVKLAIKGTDEASDKNENHFLTEIKYVLFASVSFLLLLAPLVDHCIQD